jgi:hypothetical protein
MEWSHGYELKLGEEGRKYCCGLFGFNMYRIGIYFLLTLCIWCAFTAFFEGVILGYAVAGENDSCPAPKRATDGTVVECFIYQNSFDHSPQNKTFPIACNRTMKLTFSGSWVGCFAWIYLDVAVEDVIEELGICTGIIAFFGSIIAIISYLCRKHRWRLIFDILACLAVAAIPVLIYKRGNVPLLTYILLLSLSISIIITECLLNIPPLLTWLCLAKRIIGCVKYRIKPDTRPT